MRSDVCCDSDVDECSVNNGGCSQFATCTNEPGDFTCTCNLGYTGDRFTCTGKINARWFTLLLLPDCCSCSNNHDIVKHLSKLLRGLV